VITFILKDAGRRTASFRCDQLCPRKAASAFKPSHQGGFSGCDPPALRASVDRCGAGPENRAGAKEFLGVADPCKC